MRYFGLGSCLMLLLILMAPDLCCAHRGLPRFCLHPPSPTASFFPSSECRALERRRQESFAQIKEWCSVKITAFIFLSIFIFPLFEIHFKIV